MATEVTEGVRIVTAPSIYVLARQTIDGGELARYLESIDVPEWTTDAPSPGEAIVEVGGRVCYDSHRKGRPGGNAAYISHIVAEGHGRVTEHAVLSLILCGISRTLAQELYTHTIGFSKSMRSQRFVNEDECAFVVPPALVPLADAYRELSGVPDQYRDLWAQAACRIFMGWLADIGQSRDAYARWAAFLEENTTYGISPEITGTARRKAAREAARSVLPGCAETRIVLTGNARAFRWLCEARGAAAADAEFRRLIIHLVPVLKREWPNLFADISTVIDGDGREVVAVGHRKV